MFFHGFCPRVHFHFVLVVEVDIRVGSVDLGQSSCQGVSFSELVVVQVVGLMSLIGFLLALVCLVSLLMVLQYCCLSLGFRASNSFIQAAHFSSSSLVFIFFL